jgi:predicted negative regulator of RcsB-dependent stress response
MAAKTGEGRSDPATASASANQRLKLQTDLGKALMFSRGFGAEETEAALIRARELAAAIGTPTERFTIYYGLWVGNLVCGKLGLAHEIADTFLHEAEREALTIEAEVGRYLVGLSCLLLGDLSAAQTNLVEAINTHDPEHDREARLRFGPDSGATARTFLAIAKWLLGEVGLGRALIEEAIAHATETGHVPTLINIHMFKALLEMVRGDAEAARRDAEIVVKLTQENALAAFATQAALQSAWASARLDGRETRTTELRQALVAFVSRKLFVPFFQGLLAEIEAQDDVAGALTRIDEALAVAGQTGEHWSDAFLHRLRGEILLKGDPGNTAPAEKAFLTAIALSLKRRGRAVWSYAQLWIWHDFIIPRAVPRMLMPCSLLRSRVFRRPRISSKSKRRKLYSVRWRRESIERASDFPARPGQRRLPGCHHFRPEAERLKA